MSAPGKSRPQRVGALPLAILFSFFGAGLAVLACSLYKVQVQDVAAFRSNQSRQFLRRVQIPGRRGRILDRNGEVLAEGRPGVCVACYPDEFRKPGSWTNTVEAIDAAANALCAAIGRKREISRKRIERHVKDSPPMPLILAQDLDDAEQARFAEHSSAFPGLAFYVREERVYPRGPFAAHVLGYVGRERPDQPAPAGAPPEALAEAPRVNYYNPELRGRDGVEKYYDRYLAGSLGENVMEVDSRGGMRNVWTGREARPGPDIRLTIDSKVQTTLENALSGLVGAGVVIDPRNGDILAMASSPAFDPNDFEPFIGEKEYAALRDNPAHPLLNRAIAGQYAPGSTFKPVTALAALSSGAIDAHRAYDCKGVYRLGAFQLHCWNRWGHGPIALKEAISQSCNTYFCDAGRQAGTNAVISAARAFGLGSRTGIDLLGEAAGTVPDAAWKRKRLNEPWYPGDLCQMSIGQGFLLATPLQMAVVCAALANGGDLVRPRIALPATEQERGRRAGRLPFSAEDIESVREGMRAVAEEGTGRRISTRQTADGAAMRLNASCAGKTGTAEIGSGENKRKNTWVIAFAPYEHPTAAVALVVEDGESGGLTAAPRVHDVLAAIFGEVPADGSGRAHDGMEARD